jgi:anthranilate phosphoribosyltransferase
VPSSGRSLSNRPGPDHIQDEITTADPTDVWTASGDGIRKVTFDTARFGLRRAQPGDLAGGDAPCNAKVVRAAAAGETGPARDAVLSNAGGALAVRNSVTTVGDFGDAFAALDEARATVGTGAAARLLDQWIALASELADPR